MPIHALFRAARLVVDVGLHQKEWSRDQAIRFLMDTTLTSSESGAASEVDRYIAVSPRPWVTKSASSRSAPSERKPKRLSERDSISANFMTSCFATARYRWIFSKPRWISGFRTSHRYLARNENALVTYFLQPVDHKVHFGRCNHREGALK